MPTLLSPEQVKEFHTTGVLLLPAASVWTDRELKLILDSVQLMENWTDAPGKYMKYYERKRVNDVPTDEKILCRMENFTQFNPGLDFILNGDKMLGMIRDLYGEDGILYKEKINYKLPGGDGFAAHQDVAAGWWMYGQSLHISTLISVDPATEANGCLEYAPNEHLQGMRSPAWKEIPTELVNSLRWVTCPTQPGDVLFFDSFVPHRSAPNNTNSSRRVLYATYAKAAEGDLRDRYYADKRMSYPPDCERDPNQQYAYKI